MRVAVVAPHFAEYATRLAGALARDASVLLITEARNQRVECEGLDLGDPTRVTSISYPADYTLRLISVRGWSERRAVHRAIDAFAPDVLHVQEQGDAFTASLVERYARSRPVVVTVHDPLPHTGDDSKVAQRFANGLARIRAAASAYHVHGAYCEDLLRRVSGTLKPIVATAHGTILTSSASEVAPHESRFLFFGRMEAYKGIDVLLDAVDRLAGENMTFVVAGRGPELERWRDRIARIPSIELIEAFLSPSDAIRQFQSARAVIVPYRDATQSGVVSAAFGNGRPVIASRVGGLVDAVDDGETGLLIPPNDAQALVAAIRTLRDPETSDRLAAGARTVAQGRFAWTVIADRLHALYEELAVPS